ncbi:MULTISPECIES: hypothetical protein [unclassified Rhodococcus (in: high G+C Gram-positive bacteria)]|uniref:hypothetical protein n=1 Tax=unclassified Rhodococcus (in: high G+C Gram-positive bacteria) TaxID=192944 RepID=UPI0005606425|nr:hypothetical protein [Rhodococcus sp. DK17]
MSVDIAVAGNVTSGAGAVAPAGGVFPVDGVFVEIREGGGWMAGWLVADRTEVAALSAARAADAAVERWVSVALVPMLPDAPPWCGRVRSDQVVVAPLQRPVPVWWDRVAGPLAQVLAERRETRALREQLTTTQTGHTEWIESLASDAREWADDNSLCGQFDRFMEEHGLQGRYRDFTVDVSVSITLPVTLTISASGESNAEDKVDRYDVEEALRHRFSEHEDFTVDDFTVQNVTED